MADNHDAAPRGRTSLLRRLTALALLVLFCGVIGAYWFVTDPQRVRAAVEAEFSRMLRGRVEIEGARLSLFDGLLLRGVKVWAGDREDEGSRVFEAAELQIAISIGSLLAGRIEPSSVLALNPRIRLCEEIDGRTWNFQRLFPPGAAETRPAGGIGLPENLPRFLLRAGAVEYGRWRAGRYECVGTLAIDGRLAPLEGDGRLVRHRPRAYAFDLHSRAPGQSAGPRLRGVVDLSGPVFSARLEDVAVDENIRRMFPAEVQRWWDEHQLAGRLRVPRMTFIPGGPDRREHYSIEVELDSVRLLVLPRELAGGREHARNRVMRPGIVFAEAPGLDLVRRTEAFDLIAPPLPLDVRNVSGRIVFASDGIALHGLTGRIENNTVFADGRIAGYDEHAPFRLRVIVRNARIPWRPRYLACLPEKVRQEYWRIQPAGRAGLTLQISRSQRRGELEVDARLEVLSGGFCFADVPYPLRDVRGVVRYHRDPATRRDRLDIEGLRGRGIVGTANAECDVAVSGWISPLGIGSEVDVRVAGRGVHLDDHLRAALPRDAGDALTHFHRIERGQRLPPEVFGDFQAHVTREYGRRKPTRVAVDLDIRRGRGMYEGFPYPLEEISGTVLVRHDHVELRGVRGQTGPMSCTIDGRVWFRHGEPVTPELSISARSLPVDDTLAAALSAVGRDLLKGAGLGGLLDVDGTVFLGRTGGGEPAVDYDLRLWLRDGRAWAHPVSGYALEGLLAEARLRRELLGVMSAEARFGGAPISGVALLDFSGGPLRIDAEAAIEDLAASAHVRALLPAEARRWWDELRPEGKAGLRIGYSTREDGGWRDLLRRLDRLAAREPAAPAVGPATMPSTRPAPAAFFEIAVGPRAMTVNPRSFPWPVEGIEGGIIIRHDGISITGLSGRHGATVVTLRGTGDGASAWDLTVGASGVVLDDKDELRRAMPAGLRDFFSSIDLKGTFSFEEARVAYRRTGDGGRTTVEGQVDIAGGSLKVGIPLTHIRGRMDIGSIVLDADGVQSLSQKLSIASAKWGERPIAALSCDISRRKGEPVYRIAGLRADLCGGRVGADIDIGAPGGGGTRYAMRLSMRDVDLCTLIGDPSYRPHGRLTASLDMQGRWDDAASRRGSGWVEVEGRDLYRVPVLLADMQMGDVSMPVNKPFQKASVRYSFAGQRSATTVYLEQVELRAAGLLMQGAGTIDLDKRDVRMDFSTDTPQWYSVPVVGPFLEGPGRQFLRIRVSGTVNDLKVEGRPLGVFTTSIERVLDIGGRKK